MSRFWWSIGWLLSHTAGSRVARPCRDNLIDRRLRSKSSIQSPQSSAGPARSSRSRLIEGLDLDGHPHLDRIADRILAPLEPAAVVDGDPRPTHQVGVEPGLARPPARPTVERHPLVGPDPGLLPVSRDLGVGAHRVVDVAVVLHVVGIRTAIPPDIAGNPAGRDDVVVAARRADVLLPGADADEGCMLLVGQDLLCVVDVDDDLRAPRDSGTEGCDPRWRVANRVEQVTRLDPVVVSAIEQADVVDAGVMKNQRRAACGNLSGAASGPLLVGMALRVAAIEDNRGVVGDPERTQGRL